MSKCSDFEPPYSCSVTGTLLLALQSQVVVEGLLTSHKDFMQF